MKSVSLHSMFLILLALQGVAQTGGAGLPPGQPGAGDTTAILNLLSDAGRYLSLNAYDSADHYAGRALENSRRLLYRQGKARSQSILGESALERNDVLMSVRYYYGALREFEMMGDSGEMAEMDFQIGKIYKRAGLYGKAVEYLLTAFRLYSMSRKQDHGEALLLELADSYFLLQDYQMAEKYYSGLLPIYQSDNEEEKEVFVIDRLILCYTNSGRYEQSLAFNLKLLERYRSTGDRRKEAVTLNNLGYIYKYLDQFEEASRFFAESIEAGKGLESGVSPNPATLVNLAVLQQNLGDTEAAVATLHDAVRMLEDRDDQSERMKGLHMLSNLYLLEKDYYNARVYTMKAMELAENMYEPEFLEQVYLTASHIDEALYEYERSFGYYQKYLDIRDSIERSRKQQQETLLQQQYLVERAEKDIAMLLGDQEIKDRELIQLRLESQTRQQQLLILQKNDSIQRITIQNQELERDRALQELLLAEERLSAERKDREITDLRQREEIQTLELQKRELQQQQDRQEIALLTKDNMLNELALSKARSRNLFMLGISVLAMAVLYAVYRGLRFARKANRTLARQNVEISQQKEEINQSMLIIDEERKKSDRLLLNILPVETANELKEKGEAFPRHYEMVTILFTDFVGFTFVAERMTPAELIGELNHCFSEFDKIIDKHQVEKIKTIGDSYMCAGGIPVANASNPVDVVLAALEIRDFVTATRQERLDAGKDYWEVRIGVNTGAVMAGVVGKNKFAYDIWGDAVNTASRMESSGKSGMVNISGATYQLVKDHFTCSYRGKVQAKNKGEVDMYFVEEMREEKGERREERY